MLIMLFRSGLCHSKIASASNVQLAMVDREEHNVHPCGDGHHDCNKTVMPIMAALAVARNLHRSAIQSAYPYAVLTSDLGRFQLVALHLPHLISDGHGAQHVLLAVVRVVPRGLSVGVCGTQFG